MNIKFWQKSDDKDFSKIKYARRPANKSSTGGLIANAALLKGIYTGSAIDFQLSSATAYTPVKLPSILAGIPSAKTQDETTKNLLKKINLLMFDECPIIAHSMLLYGTAWRWARWSDKLKKVIWENISDESIVDIVVDLDTEEISEIFADENIAYSAGENEPRFARRKRHITKTMVTTTWTGAINKREEYQNSFGFLPIPFAHEALGSDWRGNSVYSRIIRPLKVNHDILYTRDEILSKFRPKLIQTLNEQKDAVNKWLINNGFENPADIDPFAQDFFVNVGMEKTEMMFLASDATRQHTEAIDNNSKRIVVGSGVPEIFWGTLATGGNYNTAYSQIHLGVEFIKSIQREMTKAFTQLINQTLQILAFTYFEKAQPVEIKWGALDFTSPTEKAQILSLFSGAMNSLIQSAGITKEQIKYFYDLLFPDAPELTAELMREGFLETLTEHTSHLGQNLLEVGDLGEGAGNTGAGSPGMPPKEPPDDKRPVL
ncbi:MAG: hypothetical protein LBQ37_02510 [Elusimicrobiota bacterium]|jgi:hypothetical protein|nr:hypothetical protein [Elusimicrobiota bacterium]